MFKISKNFKFFGIIFVLAYAFITCISFLLDNGINIINAIGLSIFLIIGLVTAALIVTSEDDTYTLDSECFALLEDETTKED